MMSRSRTNFENKIAKRINKTKSKKEKPGYLKDLVAKLYPEIKAALDRDCDYSDIAESIQSDDIKITANTLKKYFNQIRASKSSSQEQKRESKSNYPVDPWESKKEKTDSSVSSEDLMDQFNQW